MKFQNLKNKAKYALATVAVSAMSAPVMAEGIFDTVKQEITGYKAEIIALGVIVVGISIAFAVIRIGKRGANAV